eukprot:g17178.t1
MALGLRFRRSPVVKEEGEAQQAPGMLLKHYAPSVLTVLLSGQGICHERMDALPRRTVLLGPPAKLSWPLAA